MRGRAGTSGVPRVGVLVENLPLGTWRQRLCPVDVCNPLLCNSLQHGTEVMAEEAKGID